VAFKILSPS